MVYRAHDDRLGRDVAIKVLAAGSLDSAGARSRFRSEARILSKFNNPAIQIIYDFDTADGLDYLVSELVPGMSLDELLASGPLPEAQVLRFGGQLAQGLAAAHSEGVLHRDLKPSNLKVTPDGRLKILDFGLATLAPKAIQNLSATLSMADSPGSVVGTLPYMAPEQLLGSEPEERSDIYSAGVVLFELATRRLPFSDPGIPKLIDNILHTAPPTPSSFHRKISAELERIILKCLEKDPEVRYQTARDLAADLRRMESASNIPTASAVKASAVAVPMAKGKRWMLAAAGALLAVAVIVVGIRGYLRKKHDAELAALNAVPFTSYPGVEISPSFSPDGSQIVFGWTGEGGKPKAGFDLYVKSIGSENLQRLTNEPSVWIGPAWSPDGSQIAFSRDTKDGGGIFLLPAKGGTARKLIATHAYHPRVGWSANGESLAYADSPSAGGHTRILVLSLKSLESVQIAHDVVCQDETSPAFSPDGKTLGFVCIMSFGEFGVAVIPVAGGSPRVVKVFHGWPNGIAWTNDNKRIVVALAQMSATQNSLQEVNVSDGEALKLSFGAYAESPVISRRGDKLAYDTWLPGHPEIWRADLRHPESPPVKLISSTRYDFWPVYSPDGKSIVFFSTRSGAGEIWMCNAEGRNLVQLSNLNRPTTGGPNWSPDSQKIVFESRPTDHPEHSDIYVVDVATRELRKVNITAGLDAAQPSWSHDGKWIYFIDSGLGSGRVFRVPAEGGQPTQLSTQKGLVPFEAANLQLVYFSVSSAGSSVLQSATLNPTGTETRVEGLPPLATPLAWQSVEGGIYFRAQDTPQRIDYLDFATRQIRRVYDKADPESWGLMISPDARYALYSQEENATGEIMLVEHFR